MARVVVEEGDGRDKKQGEGRRRRAQTLVDFMHQAKILSLAEYSAAGRLRNLYFLQVPPSEGVSSYGQSPGGANPARKADYKARRLTGILIDEKGGYTRGPSQANRRDRWSYEDALLAMCGCHTEDGEKVIDPGVRDLMLRAIIDNEDMITQSEIGSARAGYKSGKQVSAYGAGFVIEKLRRLALHFGLMKGEVMR